MWLHPKTANSMTQNLQLYYTSHSKRWRGKNWSTWAQKIKKMKTTSNKSCHPQVTKCIPRKYKSASGVQYILPSHYLHIYSWCSHSLTQLQYILTSALCQASKPTMVFMARCYIGSHDDSTKININYCTVIQLYILAILNTLQYFNWHNSLMYWWQIIPGYLTWWSHHQSKVQSPGIEGEVWGDLQQGARYASQSYK